jgi:hypothetical protein
MPIALQIRDVPIEVRDAIAEQARREGQSVQAYLLRLVEREARLLQNAEAFERTRDIRVMIPPDSDPVDVIQEGRDSGFDADRTGHR